MILILLAYIGGVLTIVSHCILRVLPFVFTASDRPFIRSGLPLLAGMALATVGDACQRIWPRCRAYPTEYFWIDATVWFFGRSPDAARRGPREPPFQIGEHRSGPRQRNRRCASARMCNRIAVGALCRANSGPDSDRRSNQGGDHRYNWAFACLRRRGWHVPRRGSPDRWPVVRGDEEVAGCRRVG